MAIELGRGDAPPSRSRPGLFRRLGRGIGWLATGPKHWAGVREIREGGALIGALGRSLRGGQGPGALRLEADGGFDLEATAFRLGVGVDELLARLAHRRRQTARIAWSMWGLATAFLAAWLWQALATELSAARLFSLLNFLPFILLFVLLGAQAALTNFQIRAGRAAGWREWVAVEDGFWPS